MNLARTSILKGSQEIAMNMSQIPNGILPTEYWMSRKCDLKWRDYIGENKSVFFLWQVFSWQLYEAAQECGVLEVVPAEMDYWKNASEVGKAAW